MRTADEEFHWLPLHKLAFKNTGVLISGFSQCLGVLGGDLTARNSKRRDIKVCYGNSDQDASLKYHSRQFSFRRVEFAAKFN
jgi:hypothetical protein